MNPFSRFAQFLRPPAAIRATPALRQWAQGLTNFSFHSIFWLWNGLFLMVAYLLFLPLVGVQVMGALITGQIPFPFVVPLVAVLGVPPVCTLYGLWRLRKHPTSLIRLFYGVEAPIIALSLLRLFVLRELTPASTLVVVVGAVAIATITLELVFGYAAYHKGLAWAQMMAHAIALMLGLYVGAILLFYTVPVLCQLVFSLVQGHWWQSFVQQVGWAWSAYAPTNIWEAIGFATKALFNSVLVAGMFALMGFSLAVFVSMPYALVTIFTRSWQRIHYAFRQQFGQRLGWGVTGGVALVLTGLFLLTAPQPQAQAFALLAQAPDSAIARQALIRQSPQIRAGLLNAYLMPYRYLSPWQAANNLRAWYPTVFPITTEQANQFQQWHNALLSPFLYRGDRDDVEKAAKLYAQFFDTPIQKAEAAAIKHALQSTANRDTVEASLLNITDRVVALSRQEVTVDPQGDWAEITLSERYENFTRQDQEIVYQFSLPESAVLTGLWLGEPGLKERYPFVVSPRGAAQKVYKQEIERAQQQAADDPALLEQVGPRQYRLRVFPIPARTNWRKPGITDLWLTYQVPQQNGLWPLPQLTEKRNLYWTKQTERYRLGQRRQSAPDRWYEAGIPVAKQTAPQAHTVTLEEGYQVKLTPAAQAQSIPVQNQHFAIVVDTSRSMGDRASELAQAIQESAAIAATNTVDWYITSAVGMPPQKLAHPPQMSDLTFFGSLPLTEQLQQVEDLRQGAAYEAVFLLTDAGNYELEKDAAAMPPLPGSLWLVHLGGAVPVAYGDALQEHLYQSRGGVTNQLAAAVERFATEQHIQGTAMDGYQWQIAATSAPPAATADPLTPVAARQVIRWLSRSQDLTQVEALDGLHAIAKRTAIVTPYSSMLVLVNERQRAALKAAENDSDRFHREIETGEDVLTNPGNPLTASVPENSAPLGILLAGGWGLWVVRSRPAKATTRLPHDL